MNNEQIILGLLYKKDRTGYELNDVFKNIFSHFYDASFGMIYPTLRRLAKNGLVTKKMVVQAGRPNKNLYSITVAGKKDFEESLALPTIPDTRHSDFLMRLYFGEYETETDLTQIMKEQVAWLKAQIEKLQKQLQDWPKITKPQKLSFTIGISEYQAQLRVLQSALKNTEIDN